MMNWARALSVSAGIMGAAGVAIAAAGTHSGGGDLARTAVEFLMIHASVVLALGVAVRRGLQPHLPWIVAASVLAIGTVLFSADLVLIAFWNMRPLPVIAPIGGTMMMLGWLMVAISAAVPDVRR